MGCRGISPILASLILISVTVSASILIYDVLSGSIKIWIVSIEVSVESMSLVRDSEGNMAFSITVKNTGGKAISKCEVTLCGEGG